MSRIIDAHTHIWDPAAGDYTWITPELAPLDRAFSLDDVAPERDALGVTDHILVQAADTDGDTVRMLAEAARHPEVVGIVGWVPLTDRARVEQRLDELRETGLLVGVRALIHDMPDPEWVLRDDVGEGLDAVAAAGLAFDVVTSGPPALALVPQLAKRHPTLRIVIDHLGKPPIGGSDAEIAAWQELLAAAAESPQVAAKLSGLASSVGAPDSWTVDALRPIVSTAVDTFGAERLMFGGDWPVSLLAGGYTRTFEGLHDALDVDTDALEHIHHRTATRWYRLQERTS